MKRVGLREQLRSGVKKKRMKERYSRTILERERERGRRQEEGSELKLGIFERMLFGSKGVERRGSSRCQSS